MYILNKAETARLEEETVAAGTPHIKLMEVAGGTVAKFVVEKLGVAGKSVAVVCGRGNNGGDGFACARKLAEGGATVRIILADGQPATDDAIDLLGRCERAEINCVSYFADDEDEQEEALWSIEKADIVIDAIFGLGFHGDPDEHMAQLIECVNLSEATVVAVDIPSGVAADTGAVSKSCVKADYTVTFTTMKPGHVVYPGVGFCGSVFTSPIGIDEEMISALKPTADLIDYHSVKICFRERNPNTSKSDYGTLLIIAGSLGMAGAAVFAGKAAASSGVGLVRMVLPKSIYQIVAGSLHDPVYIPLGGPSDPTLNRAGAGKSADQLEQATACLIGCGMGKNEDTRTVLHEVLATGELPFILDADAINLVADDKEILKLAKGPVILTPHPGEMGRLVNLTAAEVQSNRLETAVTFAREHGVYVVLKGANTICAMPDGKAHVNLTGNPGMSKGGTGDILAGLIGSLLAQGLSPEDACTCGVYIHGAAGDKAVQRFSQRGVTPTDIINELPGIFLEIER